MNGTASWGGYELALATAHIILVDDNNSTVSLPEVWLLGVAATRPALLQRNFGDADSPPDWLSFFMFTFFTDRDGKHQLASLQESAFDPCRARSSSCSARTRTTCSSARRGSSGSCSGHAS